MNIAHRKVTKKVRFTDANGNALANAKIRVRQTEHAFLFGCGGFDFIPFVMKGLQLCDLAVLLGRL